MNDTRPTPQPADIAASRTWAAVYLSDPAGLPVSFRLDGQPVRGIPATWAPTVARRRIDANIVETTFEGTDPATGLNVRVECTAYQDYPVVEWVAWLSHTGPQATPLISDLLALDGIFAGEGAVLYHCNGDYNSGDGYTPEETPLPAGETLAYAPNGGRPCDGAFPYYRLAFAEGGLSLAIGWPAQWSVRFEGLEHGVQVRAGQQQTHLRLLPGERIRTPRMAVLSWAGDASRAVNLWRRWYLAHVLPRPTGQPLAPLLAGAGTDEGEEFTAATEENQAHFIDRFVARGIRPDVWWIDAGWYPCRNAEGRRRWWLTGSWEPDAERFPHGLQPVSGLAAAAGADLLLWFEPERIQAGTRLDREHPEWLLHAEGNDNALLDLGNPACRQWLTDHVCRLIQENGIRVYRQDHNFPPLAHWRQNEAEDRQGMHENLHVQGYLRFWDDLLARNPGLWIDSCASGGRRNDLETMRRSVPLHYTDYGYGDHAIKLAFHHTLFDWIPYFKESPLSWDLAGKARFDEREDSFSYHCALAPMLATSFDIRRDDYDYALARRMIAIWRRAAGLILHGDYYPHTPPRRSTAEWVAWQFDRPEIGLGVLQGIRLPDAPQETFTLYPKGLRPGATYRFENPESGETCTLTGQALQDDGFSLALPPRSGAVWFYRAEGE